MRDYDILVRVELDGGNTTHEERRKIDDADDASDADVFAETIRRCLERSGLPRLSALLADVAISAGRSFNPSPDNHSDLVAVAEAESAFREAAVEYLEAVYQYDAGAEARYQDAVRGVRKPPSAEREVKP